MNLQKERLLRSIIKKNKLGALIFWRPDELVMLCGYLPLWGLSFLIYTESGPLLFVPELEPEDILPKDISVRKFPWGVMDCSDPWKVLFEMISTALSEKGLQHSAVSFIKSIGGTAPCIMSGEQPPLPGELVEKLSSLTAAGYEDASEELRKLYVYKTAEDVYNLKRTHNVAGVAVRTFYKNLKPGVSEAEVAALIEYEVQRMTGTDGVDFAKAWPMVLSGENAIEGGRYNRSTGKKLQQDEMVMLEMAVCVNGYWADISRTGQTSQLSEKKNILFNMVLEAQQKAIASMRPGVQMAEIDAIARRHIEEAGYGKLYNHALGHHVGFRYHDPGPTLAPGSGAVLEEGMLLTVEPGIYGKDINCGIRIEDNVLIVKDGCKILSAYPRSLNGQ